MAPQHLKQRLAPALPAAAARGGADAEGVNAARGCPLLPAPRSHSVLPGAAPRRQHVRHT